MVQELQQIGCHSEHNLILLFKCKEKCGSTQRKKKQHLFSEWHCGDNDDSKEVVVNCSLPPPLLQSLFHCIGSKRHDKMCIRCTLYFLKNFFLGSFTNFLSFPLETCQTLKWFSASSPAGFPSSSSLGTNQQNN